MSKKDFSRREFVRAASVAGAAAALPTIPARPASGVGTLGKPAILGGKPACTADFPSWPQHKEIDEDYFLKALRRNEWCRLSGNTVTQFEEKWAEMLGVRHATGVVNGTNALYASLYALGVGPGDEVLVPPYTFIATVNAVLQLHALPVFVDTDRMSLLMDATKMEERITEHTRCAIPVHLAGSVADMDTINSVAKKHNLGVIEDACQAHFSEWKGKRTGSLGDLGCFSFQASKILPCGEGGAIVSNREDLLDVFHAFQNNGRDRLPGRSTGIQHQGTNLRMTEFQAALLLAQLTRFEEICAHREGNVHYFNKMLEEVPGISPARLYEGCTRSTYYIHVLKFHGDRLAGMTRDRFREAAAKEGVHFSRGYKPLDKEPFLRKLLSSRGFQNIYSKERLDSYWRDNHCPENDRACEDTLYLGQRYFLGKRSDVDRIIEALLKIQANAAAIASG
jgi:dTDP-4-amino-4,6-dideoxygalactose transaminase